ncbi:MAG TPA: XdhC family protein [Gaiellales bacterium]|nr:XdhC family protein [Gaiellales bacterium]
MRDVIDELTAMLADGRRVAVATVVSTRRSAPRPVGSRMLVDEHGAMVGSVSGGCVESDVALRAAEVLAGADPQLVTYGIADEEAFAVGLPCGGEIEVFVAAADPGELERVRTATERGDRLAVTTTLSGPHAGRKVYSDGGPDSTAERADELTLVEHYAPAPVLLVFGAVDTAQALCRIANMVGFHTVVSDARARFATAERLPDAAELVVGWPAVAYEAHPLDEATYVVALTHDPRFEEPALGPAIRSNAPYIGALGSRRAQEARRRRLRNAGYSDEEIDRVRAPVGLDLGAISPAETAVSVLAEIIAVRNGRSGGPLSAAAAGRIHPEAVAGA